MKIDPKKRKKEKQPGEKVGWRLGMDRSLKQNPNMWQSPAPQLTPTLGANKANIMKSCQGRCVLCQVNWWTMGKTGTGAINGSIIVTLVSSHQICWGKKLKVSANHDLDRLAVGGQAYQGKTRAFYWPLYYYAAILMTVVLFCSNSGWIVFCWHYYLWQALG